MKKKLLFSVMAILMAVILPATAFAGSGLNYSQPYTYSYNPKSVTTKTADYTATYLDDYIKVTTASADITITLPTIASLRSIGFGKKSYKILKTDSTSYLVSVAAASGNTIGGGAARKLREQNDYMVISTGPNNDWLVSYETPYVIEDHGAGTVDVGTVSYGANQVFEGATADDYETTLGVVDPTADISYLLPDATAGTYYVMATALSSNAVDAANSVTGASNGVKFEGATADDYETTLTVTDPTADRTVTMPDATGTVAMTTGLGSTTGIYTAPTTSTTFTTADCGKIVGVATDALTHVLPNSTAGCCFTFTNTGAAGNNVIKIDVDSDDQIFGTVTLAASVVVIAGSAGDSVSLTKATGIRGDSMTLCGVGSNVWNIISSTGIWADTN